MHIIERTFLESGGILMRYLSKEEMYVTTRFLFLSMAIVVIQQDLQHIDHGDFKIKKPYMQLLHKMNTIALQERKQLRQQMYQKKLQIVHGEKTRFFSTFIFIAQQKQEEKNYFNPAIRNHVEIVLQELMQKASHLSEVTTDD